MKTSPQWFKTLVKSITANDQVLGEMLAEANKENNNISFSYKVAPKEINIDFKGLSQPEVLPLFLKNFLEYGNKIEQAQKIIASSNHFARFYSSTRIINIWNYDLGCYFEFIDNYGKNKPSITLCFKDNLNNGILPGLLKVERLKSGSLVAITNNNEIICFNDLLTLREDNSPGINIIFKAQIPNEERQNGKRVFAISESQVNNDLIDLAIWDSNSLRIWYGQIDISPKNAEKKWTHAQEIKVTNERINDRDELVRSTSEVFEVSNVRNMLLTTSEKVINNKREFFGNMLVNIGPESRSRAFDEAQRTAHINVNKYTYREAGIGYVDGLFQKQHLDKKIDDPGYKVKGYENYALCVNQRYDTIYEINPTEWRNKLNPSGAKVVGVDWLNPHELIFHHDFYITIYNEGEVVRAYDKFKKSDWRATLPSDFRDINVDPDRYFYAKYDLVNPSTDFTLNSIEGRLSGYRYDPYKLREKLSFKIPDADFYLTKLLSDPNATIKNEVRLRDKHTVEFRITIAGHTLENKFQFELPGKEVGIGADLTHNFVATGYLEVETEAKVLTGNADNSQLIHLHFIEGESKSSLIFAKDTGIDDVHSTGKGVIINNNEILVPVLKNADASSNSWKIYQFKNNLEINDNGLLNKQQAKLYARLPQALVKNPKLYAITENANDKPWVFVVDDNFIGSYVGQNNSEVLPNTNAQFELFQIYDNDSNAYKLNLSNESELMIFREQNNARILGNFTDEKSIKSFKKWINLRYDGKPYHKDNFPYVYAWNYKRDILQNNFKAAYCADEDGEFYLPIKDTVVKNNEVKFISILKNTTLNTPTGKLNAHKVQIIDNNSQLIDDKKHNFHHKTPFDNYQITFALTFNVFMFENKLVNERYANLIASLWKDTSSFDKLRLTHFRVKVKLPKYDTSQGNKRFVGTYETTKEFEINPDNVLIEGSSAFMYFPFAMETDPNVDTVISDLEIGNRNTGEYNKVAMFDKVIISKDESVSHKYTYEIVKMKFLEYSS
ncbi:Hypothetical protein MAGb_3120 [Mycoplasmopsis agalactiae 14628]|uniref:Uncharacterized protein n=1 Tax=Mycoplasmopsis agalactiae 14628 TaxID=1110504 RepID=I5D694_MYCAA|nr:hypothetical protein [Mycoplasmopsis agalactiae]EIN15203.1 Hypothetical protein MAGb_3120 [Mycoplasmopsis agalactiae 14628]